MDKQPFDGLDWVRLFLAFLAGILLVCAGTLTWVSVSLLFHGHIMSYCVTLVCGVVLALTAVYVLKHRDELHS